MNSKSRDVLTLGALILLLASAWIIIKLYRKKYHSPKNE